MNISSSTVQTADMRIVWALAAIAEKYKRTWAFPTQDKLCSLLFAWYGRKMSRRTINRHLAALEQQGWIRRIRRHRRSADGQLELHSTLYQLSGRTWSAIAGIGGLANAASGWIKQRWDKIRCDRNGTISDHFRVYETASAPPSDDLTVAQHLRDIRSLLR